MSLAPDQWTRFSAECTRLGLDMTRAAPLEECGLPASPEATHGIVVAQTGGQYWEALRALRRVDTELDRHPDPLDTFTRHMARRLRGLLGPACSAVRFPFDDAPLNFMDIGTRLGCGRPSRLAVLIHPRYGTWFAFRMFFLVDDAGGVLPSETAAPENPCDSCAEAPCIAACPADAFAGEAGREQLDYERSFRYRARHTETCTAGCQSRLACPVGADYRYPADFIREAQRRAFQSAARALDL